MYKLDDLLNVELYGCYIVCGLNSEEMESLRFELYNAYPDFKTVLDKKFYSKKIGPFTIHNKYTVEDYLLSDRKVKKVGAQMVNYWLSDMGMHHIKFKPIYKLSQFDKEFVQLIIDVENDKEHFLFSEKTLREHHVKILNWVAQWVYFKYKSILIMLTEDSIEEVTRKISKAEDLKEKCELVTLENSNFVKHKYDESIIVAKSTEPVITKAEMKMSKNLETHSEKTNVDYKKPRAKVMFIDAQKFGDVTFIIFYLKEGEVKAEDIYKDETTGIVYKTTGAIRLNKGENPQDYVRSLNIKDKMFIVFVNSNVNELPCTYDELVVY